MNIKFTKAELKVLRVICKGEGTAGSIADSLGMTGSFASRVFASLEEKGLIDAKKEGTQRIIHLSVASHAQSFKRLSDSKPGAKFEDWLSGYAMDMLIVMEGGASTKLILKESGCTHATMYKTLKALLWASVLYHKEGKIMTTDAALAKFVADYADNLYMIALRQLKGHNSAGTRMRKHAIIRTDAKEIQPFFVKTGLSALAEHGLEAILPDYNDLYFNLNQERRELSLEEAFAHALWMVSLKQRQDMTVLTIFFARNRKKMNPRTLREMAKFYNVVGILDEIHGKADFVDTMREN